MRRILLPGLVLLAALAAAPAALAQSGVQHLTYHAGPYLVRPGANLILIDHKPLPKPSVPGYITMIKPNLHYAKRDGTCCGAIPHVDVIHLHHGVWLSNGQAGAGAGGVNYNGFYPFFAAGEEKTTFKMPAGYGWPVNPSDTWIFNYMIHDLWPKSAKVYVTYSLDFIPASSPAARNITPVHPLWMDVERGSLYPVFDVHRYSGHHGRYIFPLNAKDPYGGGPPKNEWTAQRPGVLVATAGHVHPGGLWDQLDLIRPGVRPAARHRGKGPLPGLTQGSVRLFRSTAHYFDRRGPISWDMAMHGTAPDWRVQVRPGDVLRINAAYETRRASWYESMGIMVVYMAYTDRGGVNPFTRAVDQRGYLTHGHLAENDNHGGSFSLGVNPVKFRSCARSVVDIRNFTYLPGDFFATGRNQCAPTVRRGQSLTFTNLDANDTAPLSLFGTNTPYSREIFHTVTACKNPCGLNTGISYPLANGPGNYDSTQLGSATPASGTITWSTPKGLRPGTYTYFCRIHPFMRGVFRVISG
jgi:hypothetical protein